MKHLLSFNRLQHAILQTCSLVWQLSKIVVKIMGIVLSHSPAGFVDGHPGGHAVNMLRAAGSDVDLVSIMAYAAGAGLDPALAFQAYRSYYPGEDVSMLS